MTKFVHSCVKSLVIDYCRILSRYKFNYSIILPKMSHAGCHLSIEKSSVMVSYWIEGYVISIGSFQMILILVQRRHCDLTSIQVLGTLYHLLVESIKLNICEEAVPPLHHLFNVPWIGWIYESPQLFQDLKNTPHPHTHTKDKDRSTQSNRGTGHRLIGQLILPLQSDTILFYYASYIRISKIIRLIIIIIE